MPNYRSFRILLDTPSEAPGLGFDNYAAALGEVVMASSPRFAVGIFGEWGSGKTTLMRAIQDILEADQETLTIDFNAWRYEREPDLIVPLLDILRATLLKLASKRGEDDRDDLRPTLRRAAGKVARAARALLHGSTFTAKTPVIEVQFDAGAIMEEWKEKPLPSPQSFYHAAFGELASATTDFQAAGVQRVVVFVDDLDRCLPSRALQVLESMKLFFDLQGFVFICGLDQDLISRAVASKHPGSTDAAEHVSGSEYIQKIFQLPFGLPRISSADLREYSDVLLRDSDWTEEQRKDYDQAVRPHLRFLAEQDTVNPREVKRLINSYVIQMKILALRLGDVNRNVVMVLQLMGTRSDWRRQYVALTADPQLYMSTILRPELESGPNDGNRAPQLPPSLYNYLDRMGRDILLVPDLSPYTLAAESTRSTDPSLITVLDSLRRLRVAVSTLNAPVQARGIQTVQAEVGPLNSLASRRSGPLGMRWKRGVVQLEAMIEELRPDLKELPRTWTERAIAVVDELDLIARELRNESTFGEG